MSLDTVAEDIKEEAREDAEEIRAEGDRRAEEITSEAESDAEAIVSEREDEIERRITQERERTLSSATLEAKQKRLEARRDVLQEVRADAREEVAAIDGDTRADLTRTLLADAATEFGEREVEIYGRAEDEGLIEEIVAEYDEYENYEYAGEFDCLGGVVAESEASRVRVNNTFDSVFADIWDDELKQVSDRLFENGEAAGTETGTRTVESTDGDTG
ncbi:V-type ATP synthase subunit E [Halobacteriales archaeon QS_3_64_16]|nr:MAG: V-type ATP synthase subunit E [Halobacteriales archaeon QS_3_64_16]